jgi:nucleoside phosphorylase
VLMLDEEHERLHSKSNDNNSYFFGRMGEHNVVIATLPKGTYGESSAATVATDMVRSFESIRFCLMVGIGAGIPSGEYNIRLGDVVISAPQGQLGGVVQYDLGRENADGTFTQRGHLNRPPKALLTALSSFEVNDAVGRSKTPSLVVDIQRKSVKMQKRFKHPGTEYDHLFQVDYECQSKGNTCESCDKSKTDPRTDQPRDSTDPVVHYGIIASGNKLVRSAKLRNQLKEEYNACCIEMEAAGLMNTFPCLVIRGICDYADSHKNDIWQDYAALTAAACARELLDNITPSHVKEERRVVDLLQDG